MKSKKGKKLLSYLTIFTLIIANLLGSGFVSKAEGTNVKLKGTFETVQITAGATQHVKVPFKLNTTSYSSVDNVDFTVEAVKSDTPISVISDVSVKLASNSTEVSLLSPNVNYLLEFDIEAKELASNGTYAFNIVGTADYLDTSGDVPDYSTCTLSFSKKLSVKVSGEKSASKIKISNVSYEEEVNRGDEFEITLDLTNTGDLKAKDVNVSLGDFSTQTDIVPDNASTELSMGDMASGKKQSIKFPVKVASKATAGSKGLKVTVTWNDDKKEGYTTSTSIYIDVVVPEDQAQNNGKPNLVISDVTQTPDAPTAQGRVVVAFTVKNKGKTTVKQLKFTPTGLASTGLSPTSSKPYIYIDELKAGKSKKVKMEFDLSKDITEGLHELAFTFTYKYLNKDGTDYEEGSENVNLFVRDVQNPTETVNTSVPKLIISDFNTGDEKLKAGSVFTFSFDVKNTHATMAAKNIKVTISSENNIFSQTEGSNSFYIEQIPAGATVTETKELKVKADAASNAYPLKITFEYEYEGKKSSTDGKTEEEGTAEKTVEETLNIQVAENARPVVQDIYLSSYDGSRVNEVTTLTFNFYNMGKSTLNNVTATVVSDYYQASDTSTKFIGNVEAGAGNTYEIDVIPIMEGDCPGQLKITYEDSNGDIVELFADFTSFIEPQPTMDEGIGDMGMEEMPTVEEAKKAILPTWLFIVLEVVLFVVTIFVSRKVVISLYKKKLRKQEEEDI
ncbi:COG1361 S-layer family protein [Anaerosporobacter faecicola]|uniref:COG1361 S-layer family protein n=1 Tax=Anaerosporobacter faecicola TaxID=2718714 RepID=UPI00143A696F|nr:hypothetical protein [Anaerosporobacter faecicola]